MVRFFPYNAIVLQTNNFSTHWWQTAQVHLHAASHMTSRIVIDLLAKQEDIELTIDRPPKHTDDTFVSRRSDKNPSTSDPDTEAQLSTRKKGMIHKLETLLGMIHSCWYSKVPFSKLTFAHKSVNPNEEWSYDSSLERDQAGAQFYSPASQSIIN